MKDELIPLAEEVNRVALRGVPAKNVAIVRTTLMVMIQNLDDDELEPGTSQLPRDEAKARA